MKIKFINSAILLIAALVFSASSAIAQETEAVVIDEVIAQVNDGVITLSRVKREMKNAIDAMVQQGKTPEAAKAEIEKNKGELIASLIQEELVLQKGKEMGMDSAVEGQVNQRLTQVMKEQGIKTLDQLYTEMRKVNVDPDELRDSWRKQITKEMVIQREVDQRVYLSWSNREIRDYYEKNKQKFTKPETVNLSQIFLSFAGRDETAIRQKADQLVAGLRGGADFAKTALENSDSPDVAENNGRAGTFEVKELSDKVAAAIKDVKAGGYAKFETEEGVVIVRVDERSAASSESVFNEHSVRSALTYDKLPEERKKYFSNLQKESYVKISESYKALVTPHLGSDDTKTAVTNTKK
jgi:peptidyl-prolyl cis-trans isomerase SurA